jgi:hypothetical protein
MNDPYQNDLYQKAAELPLLLAGARSATAYGDLRRAGLTRSALRWEVRRGRRSASLRRTYLTGSGAPDLLDRIKALFLVLPRDAAVGFHTAASLHGFGVLDSARLHVVVPRGAPVAQIRGVAVHEAVLPFEPVSVLGLTCVPAARCAVDLARTVRRLDALPILDAVLSCGASVMDDLRAEVVRHARLRGIRQARELTDLADPRPACRQESQARLLLYDARLPVPVPQFPVYDDGYPRYVLDLAYDEEMVGLEFDGVSHLSRERMITDRRRHNWLEGRGWGMRYITSHDLYHAPRGFVENVRSALSVRQRQIQTQTPTSPRSRAWGRGLVIKAQP